MRAASIVLLSVWVAALLQAQAPAPATPSPAPATPPAQAPPAQGGGRQGSPASQRPPQTVTQQAYSPEQVRAGQVLFVSQCGFCHGRDAMGGETGPDLTRSHVVAEDVRATRSARRAQRPAGKRHAGHSPVRHRPRQRRRVHPRSETQGGHRSRATDARSMLPTCRPGTRRRASNISTGREAVRSATRQPATSPGSPRACKGCS